MNTAYWTRCFPFLSWLRAAGSDLRVDASAGMAVALVAVPQSLAYAQLAGLPPVCGLYASCLPVIVAALWGSCPMLACGPTALSALLTASILVPLSSGGANPVAIGIWLALLCGGLLLLAGALRLGTLVNLLSSPVLKGFTNAAALLIILSQLGSILGVKLGGGLLGVLHALPEALLRSNPYCLSLAAFTALILWQGRRLVPRYATVLLSVVVLTLAVWLGGLHEGARAVSIVGSIPAGMPLLQLPDLTPTEGHWGELFSAAVAITLIIFVEVSSLSQALAGKTGVQVSSERQLTAQGLACLASGLSGGYPVSASFSRSALSLSLNARTAYVHLFSALGVLMVLLLLTPLLYYLPHAALAVIIVFAVAGLLDFRSLRETWRISRADGFCHLLTFAATLLLSPRVTDGIFLGIALTLALHLLALMRPQAYPVEEDEQGRLCDTRRERRPAHALHPTLRFDGRLIFINASHFRHAVTDLLSKCPQARALLIAAENINAIDATGVEVLRQLYLQLRAREIRLMLCGLQAPVMERLRKSGAVELFGPENLPSTRWQALTALRESLCGERDYAI